MRPLPFITFERLTLLPGDPSMSSTFGMESPTLTNARDEEWKNFGNGCGGREPHSKNERLWGEGRV